MMKLSPAWGAGITAMQNENRLPCTNRAFNLLLLVAFAVNEPPLRHRLHDRDERPAVVA